MNKIGFAIFALSVPLSVAACNSDSGGKIASASPADYQKKLQEELITAKPGSVIEIPEGRFKFDKTLSLKVDKITIRGKGMKKTILSFHDQKAGSAGMLVKANDF